MRDAISKIMSLARALNVKSTLVMATLKISDLSVGDWVCIDQAVLNMPSDDLVTAYIEELRKPIRIKGISEDSDIVLADIEIVDGWGSIMQKCEYLKSIPITAEILEKNGLFRHERDDDNQELIVLSNHFIMARTYTDVDWWRVLIYDEEIPSKELFNGIIYSVHQLQHALRLAGVEKEINL